MTNPQGGPQSLESRRPGPRSARTGMRRLAGALILWAALIPAWSGWVLTARGADRSFSHAKDTKEGDMAEPERLTPEEGRQLIAAARKSIESNLFGRPLEPLEEPPEKFQRKGGTFVTLTMDGGLRGCIGHIVAQEPILEGVQENALNAAFRDPRFSPLRPEEWDRIHVEVSILTDPEPLEYHGTEELLQNLRIGVDGVILRKGPHQATFLPQVWEQLPDKESFLTHLCLKAGLDGDAWKKEPLEVLTYQVQAFEE